MESLNKKLKEELEEGKGYAKQLQETLHKPFGDDGWVLAKELVEKIVRSFNDSLTEANSLNVMCQTGAPGGGSAGGGGGCGGRSSQDSGESRRPEVVKYRRGCYKRRRAVEIGVKVTATMEDGYAWRKYGQKEILNTKYPRCYFRCTHKYDQGCQATKQVQRVDHVEGNNNNNKKYYQTTYFGNHTCKDTTRAPQIILEDCSDPMNKTNNYCLNNQVATMAVPEETKQRCKKGTQSTDDLTDNKSSTGSTMWQDLIGPGSPSMGSYNPTPVDEVASSGFYSSGSTSLYGYDLDITSLSCFAEDFPFDFDDNN